MRLFNGPSVKIQIEVTESTPTTTSFLDAALDAARALLGGTDDDSMAREGAPRPTTAFGSANPGASSRQAGRQAGSRGVGCRCNGKR